MRLDDSSSLFNSIMENYEKNEKKVDFKAFFLTYGPKFIGTILVGCAIFLLIFFLNNKTLISALDGAFYASVFGLILGLFSFITNKGFFDIFAYNGVKLMHLFSPKRYEKVEGFNGTYDYTKSHEEKRKSTKFVCLSYFLGALIWLLVAVILYIIYKQI